MTRTRKVRRGAILRYACLVLAGLLLAGAGAYLIFGADKGRGIFLVLGAAVMCRVLVLNVPEWIDGEGTADG